jgi:hypothetical protein
MMLFSSLLYKQRDLEMSVCHNRLSLVVVILINKKILFQAQILFQYLSSHFQENTLNNVEFDIVRDFLVKNIFDRANK